MDKLRVIDFVIMVIETAIQPPRTMMEVFNSLPEGTRIQLIENNLVMSPAPLDRHQLIISEIFPDFAIHIKKSKLGTCRVAPYDVYLDEENVFQPDIIFISVERMPLIRKDGLHGAPDLIVEILSPSTAKFDLQDKKDIYERSGVKEYWIIDPEDNSTTGYYLAGNEYHEFFKGVGKIESKLLGWECSF